MDRRTLTKPEQTIKDYLMERDQFQRENARLTAENDRLRELLREAHDAMMAWHFAHGGPAAFATVEERAMGAACRAIQEHDLTAIDGAAPKESTDAR